MSSNRSNSMEAQDNIRKRVCKACDRCRLKKSKCDGASPCSRCKADNAICVFGERKKSQDKVYPKGYVEMLEQQQTQLVAGLRELYSRLQRGESWPGQPLRESSGGHPLTHDILERLDLLHPSSDNSSNYDGFEEDCNRMQQKLLERGAPFTRRRGSVSSDSEHGQASSNSSYGGTPTTRSFPFESPFARHNAPPTPPMNSPFPRQSQIVSPVKQESPMVSPQFMNTGVLDPSALSRNAWMNDSMMMDEPVDFSKPMYGFDNFAGYDQSMMMDTIAINPSDPMMPDWNSNTDLDKRSLEEFAAPISQQGVIVGKRFFQQLWRTPDYIWSKLVLCAIIGLFIGFSFINADSSRQGLLNQIFAIFTVTLIFEQLTQTLMPSFVEQRDLYESRERASRTYSWKVFVLANIVGEIPWSFISAIILLPFYYIVGLHRNGDATDDTHERGLLFFLNLFAFVMLASTTSQLFVAPLGSAETASNLALLCFFLWFLFLGVLAPPSLMEGGFYVFLYRLNPLTYWVSSIISAGLGRIPVQCSDTEITTVVAPAGQTCATYLGDYVSQNNGYIVNPAASGDCQYCPIATSDEFLSGFGIVWEQRWRDFGIQWSFIIFNIFGAVFLYWLFRVPKKGGVQKKGTKGA